MSDQTPSVHDDLAFLRTLAQDGEGFQNYQRMFGEIYFAAGLCYSVQMLLHGGQAFGWIVGSGPIALAIGIGPTVVFLILLLWLRGGRGQPAPSGVVARAVGAVFAAVGLTNLALILIIGGIAWRQHSLLIWLIYPCVVMVLQGLAWLVVFMLRRRAWLGVVAAGWFATGLAMAAAIPQPSYFIIAAGVGMFAFMLVPGAVLMRLTRRTA
ncbi:MAG: hypothetical protein ABI655_15255 [Phenylobacterium sp.]